MHNYAPCHFPNVDGQIYPSLFVVPTSLQCMLCGQSSRVATMLICDQCSLGWHMGCLMPPMEEMLVEKWFAFGASSKPRFLRLNKRINTRFFSMAIHI